MADQSTIRNAISKLAASQLLAVLSTQRDGQPYASLVAFVLSDDLADIYFATGRSTRKFTNMLQDNRIAMLLDNRSNNVEDFHAAAAVTVIGRAFEEKKEPARGEALEKYLARHPYLVDFVSAPTTALIRVEVSRYIMVTRFQEVFELHLDG